MLATLTNVGIVYLISAVLAAALSLWSLTHIFSRRTRCADFHGTAVIILAWGLMLHLLYHVLFFKWGAIGWHFIAYPLLTVMWLSGLLERALRSPVAVRAPALYTAVAASLCTLVIAKDMTRDPFPQHGGWHAAAYDAAVWVRSHTPADAVLAMSDCGHFAFFSQRRVLNLDGVVNDMELQQVLARHQLDRYLEQNHVEFLVQHAVHGREDVISGAYELLELRFPSHWFDGLGDAVSVRRQSEVYRSTPFLDGPYPSVLVTWSLRSG